MASENELMNIGAGEQAAKDADVINKLNAELSQALKERDEARANSHDILEGLFKKLEEGIADTLPA